MVFSIRMLYCIRYSTYNCSIDWGIWRRPQPHHILAALGIYYWTITHQEHVLLIWYGWPTNVYTIVRTCSSIVFFIFAYIMMENCSHLLMTKPQLSNTTKDISKVPNYARKHKIPEWHNALSYWEEDYLDLHVQSVDIAPPRSLLLTLDISSLFTNIP